MTGWSAIAVGTHGSGTGTAANGCMRSSRSWMASGRRHVWEDTSVRRGFCPEPVVRMKMWAR
jgi:hypothetical protein